MTNLNFSRIWQYVRRPEIFAAGTAPLWSDPYISGEMLKAHMDSGTDAASRSPEFISLSARWIAEHTGIGPEARMLDLGCGPGLYATRFAQAGFRVTGVDFSPRSVAFAREKAKIDGLEIEYIEGDYRGLDFTGEYDLAVMIYCDLGALSDTDRDLVLGKVYRALKPGGCFVFDVFTPARYLDAVETQEWSFADAGFWRPVPHVCLYSNYIFSDDNVYGDQIVVMDAQERVEVYRTWDHVYTPETITDVLRRTGFGEIRFFGDVAGKVYEEGSETLGVVACV